MTRQSEIFKRRTKIAAIAALTACMLASRSLAADDTAAKSPVKRTRFLLLDSRIIESTKNAKLTVGTVRKDKNNPLFIEDKPWEPSFNNAYLSIIYDEQDKIYKCWYSIFIQCTEESWIDRPREKRAWSPWKWSPDRDFGVCYATSKDGICWTKPKLGVIDFKGSKKNNIVIRGTHGVGVMKDLHETDPKKRYKAILPGKKTTQVWFSPDGVKWTQKELPGLDDGDTYNCVFWDPTLGKYVLFTRHWQGPRRTHFRAVSRSDSPDFLKWSPAKVVLAGVDRHLQIHDMPVFRHAGVYIGLVGLFETGPTGASRQHVELAWSPDSVEWRRICPGTPLIPNSQDMNDYDWGCIFAAGPIFKKDEILLYYGADKGRFMSWRQGSACLARLRPDGFAGYEQVVGGNSRTASVTTKPVIAVTGSLRLSADVAMSGYVKVTLLDKENKALAESDLIAKTGTDAEVQWKKGFSLKTLKDKDIRLRFELRDSKLYSFSFHR
ncbi:MAG: hypothetical protein QGH60_08200 [Phycisphaerae bacterium]|nr:hypothetical protein [Phycisphaerae bacterium]